MSFTMSRLRVILVFILMTVPVIAEASAWSYIKDRVPWLEGKGKQYYTVVFEGIEDKALKKWVESTSDTIATAGSNPGSIVSLKRRAREDVKTINKALRAKGYYAARIKSNVEKNEETKPKVVFSIKTGPLFTVDKKEIALMGIHADHSFSPDIKEISPKLGEAADASVIKKSKERVGALVQNRNCLLNIKVKQEVVVDHLTHKVGITYIVEGSTPSTFGGYELEGLESVSANLVKKAISWKEGECFQPILLQKSRVQLIKSKLFSTVSITHKDTLDVNGNVPILVKVKERKHRTVKAGLGYRTEDGIVASSSWEHRNFFHRGERVNIQAILGSFYSSLEGVYTIPNFLREDQIFQITALGETEDRKAYQSQKFHILGEIEREFSRTLKGGIGAGYGFSVIDDFLGENEFALFSIPMFVDWDNRNDPFEPTKGHVVRGDVIPFIDTLELERLFIKQSINGSMYIPVPGPFDPFVALRTRIGSIVGVSLADVPADERFYAGGGGSVRGYGYQKLGDQVGTDSIGGRGVFELSSELRLRFTEKIGWVIFVDAGAVYENSSPDFSEALQYGVGMGGRYYTAIGPIRMDVGIPVDRRPIDDAYQLYISLGQAF